MYTALSRVKSYDNLYCTGEFKKSAIKVNKGALFEYERLKQNDLFSIVRKKPFRMILSLFFFTM